MVDFLVEMGDRFKLRNLTIHLGVELADVFFHSQLAQTLPLNEGEPKLWHLYALVALMLGSKFDECDAGIPFYSEFKKSTQRANFSQEEFVKIEKQFLIEVLDWGMFDRALPIHYLYLLLSQGICFEDDVFR